MASRASVGHALDLPSSREVAAAHSEYLRFESRDVVYRVARDLVEAAYAGQGHFTIAEGVAVLLLSWNASFYRPRPNLLRSLVDDLEDLIQTNGALLADFRARDVRDFDAERDSASIAKVYRQFAERLWPVGTAKALHCLAPRFFPLWDDAIARNFRLKLSPREASVDAYLNLIGIGHRFASGSDLVNPLKALDEWAYVTFTIPTRRQPRS